ncbi:MAG: integrase core domain-containing protein [Planctomycetota bacterium]
MNQWIYTLVHLLLESFSAHRDAQVRFLKEENRILRSRISSQRLILDPEERTRLLTIGAELEHQVKGIVSIVQFRTYQRWVKEQELGIKPGRVGRPRKIGKDVRQVIIRMAKENPGWGYLRIVGELLKLRCRVGKTSVRRILREEGLYPKPTRPDRTDRADYQPWDQFIKLHINTLVACDFFSKAIWTPFSKRQAFVLMFVHVGSRKVWGSPTTYHPDTAWVQQQGRNALTWLEDQKIQATHLIHDRDTKFTKAFDQLMGAAEIKVVKSPIQAPNANAFAEAWVATVRRECLDYFACFSRRHLGHILHIYTRFYNERRPHQRVGNRVLELGDQLQLNEGETDGPIGRIGCHSELGGLLKHYYRQAA